VGGVIWPGDDRSEGIEARISQLKKSFGLRRTRLRRLDGAQTWAGLGVFAYILQRMAVVAR
jgi:transposase, IS5 family